MAEPGSQPFPSHRKAPAMGVAGAKFGSRYRPHSGTGYSGRMLSGSKRHEKGRLKAPESLQVGTAWPLDAHADSRYSTVGAAWI